MAVLDEDEIPPRSASCSSRWVLHFQIAHQQKVITEVQAMRVTKSKRKSKKVSSHLKPEMYPRNQQKMLRLGMDSVNTPNGL